MDFIKTGQYRPNALEAQVEIMLLEKILKSPLKRLNYLLGLVAEKNPEILPKYIVNLSNKYQSLEDVDYFKNKTIDYGTLLSELNNLKENLDLVRNVINFILHVYELNDDIDWEYATIKVTNRQQIRSFLLPRYYNLLVLTESIDRMDAIALYKQFITRYIIDTRDPDRTRYDNLESLFEKRAIGKEKISDWVMIHELIADGKYAYRNDNCLWIDALEDLLDSELKYYVCCYGDYESARVYHESVVLTMEHTIAQGHPYCSRVLHDTRVDWNLAHPPESFWDNMGPKS